MVSNEVRFYNKKHNEYPTPNWLFRSLSAAEGPFDLDAAATAMNTKCLNFCSLNSNNGLSTEWHKHAKRVWCNPPYHPNTELTLWVRKAVDEVMQGCKVCLLLPAYTEKDWWHDLVIPCATKLYFVRGRVSFRGCPQSAPFPSVAVIFDSPIRKSGPKLLSLGNWASGLRVEDYK